MKTSATLSVRLARRRALMIELYEELLEGWAERLADKSRGGFMTDDNIRHAIRGIESDLELVRAGDAAFIEANSGSLRCPGGCHGLVTWDCARPFDHPGPCYPEEGGKR